MDIPKLLVRTTFIGAIVVVIILIIASSIVRDYQYIIEHPIYFCIETIMMGILPALPLTIFFITRNLTQKQVIIMYIIMVIQLSAIHILTQLSGVYTVVFSSTGSNRFLN